MRQALFDRDYGVERSFRLYDEHEILEALGSKDVRLVEAQTPGLLGGLMYFTDPKPVDHCVFYARRVS